MADVKPPEKDDKARVVQAAQTISLVDALNELEAAVAPQWADEKGNAVRAEVRAAIQRVRERVGAAAG